LINAWRREFRLQENTAVCLRTDPSAARRFPELFMREAKPDSSFSRRIQRFNAAGEFRKNVKMFNRREMLDVVVIDGKARGIIVRNMVTGAVESYSADAVVLATGGYGNVYYLSTNAKASNVTAAWRAHKRGAFFANPCFTQIHPTCIPASGHYQSKLTLMSESLRNDGRVSGFPKSQAIIEKRTKFLNRKEIIFLKENIPHSVISYREMLHHEMQKRWWMKGKA
jgi:succinate dehydrogenase/fumarate reductase flavoprotein subunit